MPNKADPPAADPYEPELGQVCFGQPWQAVAASNLFAAALLSISRELDRVMWNVTQKAYDSPFDNTSARFECPVFKAHAYSWDDSTPQEYNFAWRDLRASWYKHARRGLSLNRACPPAEVGVMLDECLVALAAYEADRDAADEAAEAARGTTDAEEG